MSKGGRSRPASSLSVERSESRAKSVLGTEKSDYFTDSNYPQSFFQNSTAVTEMLKDPDAEAKAKQQQE